ncbi:HXXEE domain-containing protein [Aneurinibacillus uraniidurans]|uniref:HXXEE domain-containing protein n=1 Tax=Aneurinibacillus uraniidurans TaxID=2966586 RepID=UPI00234BA550|nr:HXXEE domain-containing protein [Aneurinibacillus sp. B1]WCN39733.1 HXXEE domain-containing protein [Aneurinibacillus sp. B1]
MLIFLFPILYFVHDIEEILTVEKFLANHSDMIPFRITTAQFTCAFILLWILTLFGCYQTLHQKRFLGMSAITFFSFLVPGIFLANGIGHLLQFIFFQSYVPGVVTSVLIIYPYSFFTLRYLLRKNLLTLKKFLLFLFLGFILQAPFALLALLIAKVLL